MRPVLIGLAVFALLLMTGLTTGFTAEESAYDRTKTAAEATQYAYYDEQQRLDELGQAEVWRVEDAIRADAWADTYLAAEKAVAVFWRDAYVEYEANQGRFGTLHAADGQVIRYACDINYKDARSGGCVPADRDYDCAELRSWGIVDIPVRTFLTSPRALVTPPPGFRGDWMLLDDDHDGLGCELPPQ